ncbi:MAG: hypothetical protein CMM16_01640 [Rhodospirillaceae bacterium]|nr:hypothetical protein [Rhodospirillaceae bacterium]
MAVVNLQVLDDLFGLIASGDEMADVTIAVVGYFGLERVRGSIGIICLRINLTPTLLESAERRQTKEKDGAQELP